jgi:hypothetical protein
MIRVGSEDTAKLIDHISSFFKNASSPASINCIIFGLLNKLIQNYRTLKLTDEKYEATEFTPDAHFNRINVDKNMIQSMITEVNYLKSNQADLTGNQTLFSFYLQTQIELIVGTLLPTARNEKLH